MSKARSLLETSMPFSEFDEATLDCFQAAASEQTFSSGDVLYHEMSEDDEIYFIVEGTIGISVELASAYHKIDQIEGGPGELVGEGCFIAEGPRPATVTATSAVQVLVWDVNSWKKIATENPLIGYKLAAFSGKVLFARVCKLRDSLINNMAWGIE